MNIKPLFCGFYLLLFSLQAQAQIITTIVGNGTSGYGSDGIMATTTSISSPRCTFIDSSDNLYLADFGNGRIRIVNASGIINTFAGIGFTMGGSGDGGPANMAGIGSPAGVCIDPNGNVYIADQFNGQIRNVNSAGVISRLAGIGGFGYGGDGSAASAAQLNNPSCVRMDVHRNVYIADLDNNRIRKIDTFGIITTIAGNGFGSPGSGGYFGDGGQATAAELFNPSSVAIDLSGNIFIADLGNNRIRKINASGIITTVAGTGTPGFSGDGGLATAAELNGPFDIAIDSIGNVYIADNNNHRIREINTSGIITTVAGNGTLGFSGDNGLATACELNHPRGIMVDALGNLYISDTENNRIRKVSAGTPIATSVTAIEQAFDNIFVYPNPSQRKFTVNIGSSLMEKTRIIITNAAGEKVKEIISTTNSPTDIELEMPTGMYCITATTSHGKCSEQILIAKNK